MSIIKETASLQIDKQFELPSVPLVLIKIIQALDDDRASGQKLEELILHDPSLSARILRLANSAFYSFRDEVKTISRAIPLLGVGLVRSLAIGVQIFDSFTKGMKAESALINKLWMHSFGTGIFAQQIWGRRTNRREGEFAFLCGLLHDIGKAVFFKKDPVQYGAMFAKEKGPEDPDISAFEIQFYSVSHATVGSILAKEWSLPAELSTVIARHHAPLQSVEGIVAAVKLADTLCKELEIGFDGDRKCAATRDELRAALRMSPEEFESLLGSAHETRQVVESFFHSA
jgi:putative nucleotidyltransferase with HDIG domain